MKRSLFLALVLGLIAPFFFFGGPGYHAERSFKAGWDLGHIVFFTIAALLLHGWLERGRQWSSARCLGGVFLLILLLGTGVELLQMQLNGRYPDGYDLLRNQLGALLGYLLASHVRGQLLAPWWRLALGLVVPVLLLVALWPLGRSLTDEYTARQQFPLLADFETPFEQLRWLNPRQLTRQSTIVRHGDHAVKVSLTTAQYSGTSLFYFPGNWQGYSWLHFSVYNPLAQGLELHCRIHDRQHKKNGMVFKDRYHQKFFLHQGWNDLKVFLTEVELAPASRSMAMEQIEGLGFFVIRQPHPRDIYLDYLYLSR
ncbi:VanZ family protein [Desulfogranum mediterraneum]|uniref:VanZ family protein n=1 Tax=Desulfogranum mediterraneum TaxID=160661 RepID=UPI00041613BE|nr:VanZ family protein [Desulfogranum mediterraneum]